MADREGLRVAIVLATFHETIAMEMLRRMKARIAERKCLLACEVLVPGAFETPLAVNAVLARADVDCVAVAGFIERGETLHGEQMGLIVGSSLKDLEMKYQKPIGLGIIGPGATPEQAMKRLDYGAAAVDAAIRMVQVMAELARGDS